MLNRLRVRLIRDTGNQLLERGKDCPNKLGHWSGHSERQRNLRDSETDGEGLTAGDIYW